MNEAEGPPDAASCIPLSTDAAPLEHVTAREDTSPQPVDRPVDHEPDPVEAALAKALADAAAGGRFDVVVQLAQALENRRTARLAMAVENGPATPVGNVVAIEQAAERRRRAGR